MKKALSIISILMAMLLLPSCSLAKSIVDKLDQTEPIVSGLERGYIIYDGKTYYDLLSAKTGFTYKDFWVPLSATTLNKKAVNKSSVGESEIDIKVFKDKTLDMFVLYEDFNGEWLYCDESYNLPDFKTNEVEKIYLADEKTSFTDKNCIVITNADDINNLLSDFRKASDYKAEVNPQTADEEYTIGLKFSGINALYQYGTLIKCGGEYTLFCADKDKTVSDGNMPLSGKNVSVAEKYIKK